MIIFLITGIIYGDIIPLSDFQFISDAYIRHGIGIHIGDGMTHAILPSFTLLIGIMIIMPTHRGDIHIIIIGDGITATTEPAPTTSFVCGTRAEEIPSTVVT
jgi:hypothetical protein